MSYVNLDALGEYNSSKKMILLIILNFDRVSLCFSLLVLAYGILIIFTFHSTSDWSWFLMCLIRQSNINRNGPLKIFRIKLSLLFLTLVWARARSISRRMLLNFNGRRWKFLLSAKRFSTLHAYLSRQLLLVFATTTDERWRKTDRRSEENNARNLPRVAWFGEWENSSSFRFSTREW